MKVFIIVAVSRDGFIGKKSDHLADWTGSEDKKVFKELTKAAGVMVMGQNTFKTIGHGLPGRKTVVVTGGPALLIDGVDFMSGTPAQIVEKLRQDGYKDIAICGGQSIYTQFIKSGLVTDLYITRVPVDLGSGMPLFSEPVKYKHKIVSEETLADGSKLEHQQIIK